MDAHLAPRPESALPSAWATTSPEEVIRARRTGVAEALRSVLGEVDVSEAAEIARAVCEGLAAAGRRSSTTRRSTGCEVAGCSTTTESSPPEGAAFREDIEAQTDRLALAGWQHVGAQATARLHELLRPLREQVQASDLLPRSLRGRA